jgi:hypothetical protein
MKSHSVLRDGHQIKLLRGGAEFFPELIRALEAARSHVQLETYIFDFHGAAAQVAAALERAGIRGLRVWVVVDGEERLVSFADLHLGDILVHLAQRSYDTAWHGQSTYRKVVYRTLGLGRIERL